MALCLLIAQQRSGTGAFGSAIDQHPHCKYLGEVFHSNATDKYPNFFHFLKSEFSADSLFNLSNPLDRFTKYQKSLLKNESAKNIILDVKLNSLHHLNGYWHSPVAAPMLISIAKDKNIPIIFLNRRNKLKMHISGRLAELNQTWHARPKEKIKITNIELDTRHCINAVRRLEKECNLIYDYLHNYSNCLHLSYEGMFAESGNFTPTVEKSISDFFKIRDLSELQPAFVKQTADNLSEVIVNFTEVEKSLLKTPYSWMLYE